VRAYRYSSSFTATVEMRRPIVTESSVAFTANITEDKKMGEGSERPEAANKMNRVYTSKHQYRI